MIERVGGFCPLIGTDCLQDKCEFAYCIDGEYKWCSVRDVCINTDIMNTNLNALVKELEKINKGR